MKTQPLIDALIDQSVSGMVYAIRDRNGHLTYVGSSTHTLGWRLHRHKTFRHTWPLRQWFDEQSTTALTLATVITLSPEEIAGELDLPEVPTLRKAEYAYQRAHAPIQFCVAWATSSIAPSLFDTPTTTETWNGEEYWLTPGGKTR